jgi:large subunit ribosomal protein L18
MMSKPRQKQALRERRRKHVRKRIVGTSERPRLTVHRSLKHIYAQVVDDVSGRTLASASSVALKLPGSNVEAAKAVGKAVAENAKAHAVTRVCFDRAGRLYHGRIRALADAAREAGLEF